MDDGSGDYSPDHFYCSATDDKGHGATIYVRVPPGVHHLLVALVQSGRIGAYRTLGDAVRDAIHHRAHQLDEMGVLNPLERHHLTVLRMRDEALRQQAMADAEHELLTAVRDTLRRAQDTGAGMGAALELARKAAKHLEGVAAKEIHDLIARYNA